MVLPSGLTQLYTIGPPEAAQEETQSLEAALSDEEVGIIYNVTVMPSLSDGLLQFCLNPLRICRVGNKKVLPCFLCHPAKLA